MRDTDLCEAILGLTPPWAVVRVDRDVKGQQVTITVEAGADPFPCPESQTVVPGYGTKRRRRSKLPQGLVDPLVDLVPEA